MKRFLILMGVCLCVLMGNAQVKNVNGEKVVRKVDVYMVNKSKPYISVDFNYNKSLHLEEIICVAPASGKIIWKKHGDKLTRIEYNEEGKLRTDLKYQYELTNGLVTKCVIDNIGIDGNVLRYYYVYQYSDNRIITTNKRVYFREEYDNFEELSDRYREVFEWNVNNNVFTTQERGWRKGQTFNYPILYKNRTYYIELNNDTNMDLSLLYHNICKFNKLEDATEWFGKHSHNLTERDNGRYFDYIYANEFAENNSEEDLGNIIEIDVYNQYNELENICKIYYWE